MTAGDDRRREACEGRRGRARGRAGGGRPGSRGGRGEQERGATAEHGHGGRNERDCCWPALTLSLSLMMCSGIGEVTRTLRFPITHVTLEVSRRTLRGDGN